MAMIMAIITTITITTHSPKEAGMTGEKGADPNAQGTAWQDHQGGWARATGTEGTGAWHTRAPTVSLVTIITTWERGSRASTSSHFS